MNKILRYSFMLLLAMVSSVGFAQTTVTFTAGTDKGAYDNAGNAGDKVSKNGITIETTKGNSAFAAAQYRFSKSSVTTFSSTVGNITKVVFTCTANGDTKYGPGCFSTPTPGTYTYSDKTGTWEGNATSFTLTASSNQVRATKIEVTYTTGGDTPSALAAPTISGDEKFSESTTVTITAADGASIYYTTDGQDPDDREGTEYTAPFTINATTTVKAIAYKDDLASTIAEKTFTKQDANQKGTETNPYTPAEANEAGKALAAGKTSDDEVFVKGIVSSITSVDTGQYGNARFYISQDGTTTAEQFYCYDCLNLNGAKFTNANEIAVGDEVVVTGKLQNYNGTIELARGGKIVKTNHTDKPAEEVTAANIAKFNAANNGAIVTLTLKDAQVTYSWTSDNSNTSIYLRDASGTTSIRNQKADAVQLGYKTGDVLNGTIVLTRSDYNKAIQAIINDKTNASNVTVSTGEAPQAKEITYTDAKENESNLVVLKNVDIVADGSKFYIGSGTDRLQVYNGFHIDGYTVAAATGVDVKGIITRFNDTYEIQPVEAPTTTTGINTIKAAENENPNAPVYNLSGQRVSKDYKGVVIQNGKKHINK